MQFASYRGVKTVRHATRLEITLAVVVLVLGASLSVCSQSGQLSTVRVQYSIAKAFDPDLNGNDRIEWYEAVWWYIGWIMHTGDPDIP